MDKRELAAAIIERRETVDQIIHENYHGLALKYGLSLDQFHLLLELEELMLDVDDASNSPTIGSLAKNIKIAQNTVSERITRLENKGLVTRHMDKKDRRINHVVLTDAGKNLLAAISAEAETGFMEKALARLELAELESFLACYDRLIDQMLQLNKSIK